jgi:xanthine/uracil/vitamin C permease (AzgA family)
MAVLMAKRVKGALMLGIVFTTAISWIPGHAASYVGGWPTSARWAHKCQVGSQVPGGLATHCVHTSCMLLNELAGARCNSG